MDSKQIKYHEPPVRKRYKNFYPTKPLTQHATPLNLKSLYLQAHETQQQIEHFRTLQETNYYKDFHKRPWYYDLHGKHFQDFALRVTSKMTSSELRKMSTSKDHAKKRLLRARVYACASREDVGWDGRTDLSDLEKQQKKKEMEDHLHSLKLYDWMLQSEKPELKKGTKKTVYSVVRMGTQEAVQELAKLHPDKRICWLDLANAHHVCGTYPIAFGGSQEEEVATNCDAVALLGTNGEFVTSGLRYHLMGTMVHYKPGKHIPPGGNYFCKTKFLTGEKIVDCCMIAAAFADFRTYIPFFWIYTEKSDYFNLFGRIRDEQRLNERLMLDMEGVLRTALTEKVDILVLGASGCGAFNHDPFREAKLWKQMLLKCDGNFDKIQFAILDGEKSPNVVAFKKEFGE